MKRTVGASTSFVTLSSLALALGFGLGLGCGQTHEDAAVSSNAAALAACGLDDGTVEANADLRACDPSETKKTTICHIPPGNPDNAHTLCIGNPGVAAHLRNHGDHLGPCKQEKPCPPPSTGTGGATSSAGTGGSAPSGGTGGIGGMSGGGETGGAGGVIIYVE